MTHSAVVGIAREHWGWAVRDAVKLWESGLDAEVAFWDEWLSTAVQIVLSKRAEELPLRVRVAARVGQEAHQLLPLWRLTRLRFGSP